MKMHYSENRPSKNMRELFEANLVFLDADDFLKVKEILLKAEKERLEYLKKSEDNGI